MFNDVWTASRERW